MKNDTITLEIIREQTLDILEELLEIANLKPHSILVVGCSSSEVAGFQIGSHSAAEIGETIFQTLHQRLAKDNLYIAAQSCEHLNRALILDETATMHYGYEAVNVIPHLKAGGSFATAAYKNFSSPVAIEAVRAHAGMDIGNTLIGMHLRNVAVPVRTKTNMIGSAHVVCARTRPKYIGGERAYYAIEETALSSRKNDC